MTEGGYALAFGPVPSRRLGRSLGINHIPPKTCSYACVYCQLGRTDTMRAERLPFHAPASLGRGVARRVEEAGRQGERIDYLTFVPDGEPTLDSGLGEAIDSLRPLGKPIAVISNASLLWREDVRFDLCKADWVSVKVDAIEEASWRAVNRPHKSLRLDAILEGLLEFAAVFRGRLVTETMLVAGMNADDGSLEATASFVGRLDPAVAYIAVPTRPPAEPWVAPPSPERLVVAHGLFAERVGQVELLIGYEGDEFALLGSAEESLLGIASVHPMRRDAVSDLLRRAGEPWATVERLVERGRLVALEHAGHTFYLRKLPGR